MRQGDPTPTRPLDGSPFFSDPHVVGDALDASGIALWELCTVSRQLTLSAPVYEWLPELGSIAEEAQLLALMPPADQYLFQKTFAHARAHQGPTSCEVCLAGLASQPRLRFIARPHNGPHNDSGAQQFVGVVVRGEHWLANPGPEYTQTLLSRLFSESPIPCFVTDPKGILLEYNEALEHMLHLNPRRAVKGIGRYRILKDPVWRKDPDALKRALRVFEHGEVHSFELEYPLANLHRNQLHHDQTVLVKMSLLPLRDRHGQVTRVLAQCQDRSGEQLAHKALRHRDQMLYSLINNTQNLVSVKAVDGRYLLANDSFARWLGQDAEDVCGCTDADLFNPVLAERFRMEEKGVLHRAAASESEALLPHPQGGEPHTFLCVRFPVEGHEGNLQGIGQIMTDITRQKAIEHSLHSQRQELRLLLDSMRAAICYFDRWGVVKDFNLQAEEYLGPALARGRSMLEVSPEWDDPPARQRELMQVMRSAEPQLDSVEYAQLNGVRHWFSVDKIPTKNGLGEVNGVLVVMNDITENVLREKALAQSEARYRAFIANSSEAIWRYDMEPPVPLGLCAELQHEAILENARLREGNRSLAHVFGAPSLDKLLGSGLKDPGDQNYHLDVQEFVANDYQLVDHELVRSDSRGRDIYFQISCVGEVENGYLCRVWGTSKDITTRKRYEERLEYQATHDALTHLPNRTLLYREVDAWLRKPDGRTAALLLIDLDRFKDINDTLGHQVGDQLLRQIGPRLSREMSDVSGLVTRLGGDEFAIFVSSIRHQRQALVFGHRILDALRHEFTVGGYATEISASIGIVTAPDQATDITTLMRYADMAMYRAKNELTGVALYNGEKDSRSPKRLWLMSELGRSIREQTLRLHFQPKIELTHRRCYGLEALLRWQHPTVGSISPAEFIPMAETTNLIHPLTAWVLEESVRACCEWHESGYPLSVAVNLSARSLLDDSLPKKVNTLLREYGLPEWALELEITESSIMTDPRRAMANLESLHALGVGLSIDDFGTGYSSLAYLKRLPVQTLKIDFSFVRQMLDDEQDEIIVNSTIHLAHNLGLNVVAEGVESEALLLRLQEMGCDLAQGYYISKPVDGETLCEWMAQSPWVERPHVV